MPSIDRRARRELRAMSACLRFSARVGACLALASASFAGAPGPEPTEIRPAPDAVDRANAEPTIDTPVLAVGGPPSAAATPPTPVAPRPVLDPAARMLRGDDASETWALYLELESGHRITQRFLLTNVGPGEHSAVAVGHLVEPGRAPYRYENGRRRSRWTLSDDRLFFDISASHLDLHRPRGELRITKDDIELRFFFDFPATAPAAVVPSDRTPDGYHVEVLAIGARARGTIRAPWMTDALATEGRAWVVHTWTERAEADQLARRVDVFGGGEQTPFYGIHLAGRGDWRSGWRVAVDPSGHVIDSPINVIESWTERPSDAQQASHARYPTPERFDLRSEVTSGAISLETEWLRFDPLEVIPQPFRWFIRRASQPREVWADVRIGGSLSLAPDSPSLPRSGETQTASADANASGSRSESRDARGSRETEPETAVRSVPGVASVTFLNPVKRR